VRFASMLYLKSKSWIAVGTSTVPSAATRFVRTKKPILKREGESNLRPAHAFARSAFHGGQWSRLDGFVPPT